MFALCWRRIRDGIFSAQDEEKFRALDKWFRENLPVPPFYDENFKGEVLPITWFKTNCLGEMKAKTQEIIDLLDKYKIPYDVVYSDYVGRIVYEDDFQIGTLPPETEILPIEREQLPQVLELIHKSFATVAANLGLTRENCPGDTSFMTMEKLENFFDWGLLMYGFYEDKELVGYFMLAKQEDGHYDLNNLAVLPEKRHLGYGDKMIAFAKQIKNYYQWNGFVHIGTQKYDHLPFTVGYLEWNAGEDK